LNIIEASTNLSKTTNTNGSNSIQGDKESNFNSKEKRNQKLNSFLLKLKRFL
jgi:hypothetical protein